MAGRPPKSEPIQAIVDDVLDKNEFIEVEMHQPYQILHLKGDTVKAFITQLIPRGSDSRELENRYQVDIEGHTIVLREPLLKLLFGYKGENLTKDEVDEYFKSKRG
jgi:hypothetical protein